MNCFHGWHHRLSRTNCLFSLILHGPSSFHILWADLWQHVHNKKSKLKLSIMYYNYILLFHYEAKLAIHCQMLIIDCWYPLKSVHIVDLGNICLNRWSLHLAWDEPLGVRPDVCIWQPLSYCLGSTWCIFLCEHECGVRVYMCVYTECVYTCACVYLTCEKEKRMATIDTILS